MKLAKNHLGAFLMLALATSVFAGCGKKGDDGPPATTQKLVFKAEASPGATVNMVVYGYDATLTTLTSINSQSWTSPEITAPASAGLASIVANGIGPNASSSLKVQVYVNGVMKKEGTGGGTALSATAQYNLR